MIFQFLLISLAISNAVAFRALFLSPNAGYSHLGYTGAMADALVEAGHEVDYVIIQWSQNNFNGSRKANIIRFEHNRVDEVQSLLKQTALWGDAFEMLMGDKDQEIFGKVNGLLSEAFLSDPDFIPLLKQRNYTVGFAESYDYSSFALMKMLNIPCMHQMVAFPTMDFVDSDLGTPVDFNNVPAFSRQLQWREPPSMFDRLRNIYDYANHIYTHASRDRKLVQSVFHKHGERIPSLDEIYRETAFVWLNSFETVDFARPRAPKSRHVGGIAIRPSAPLDKEMEEILNAATDGVVVVSFGSIVDTSHMKVTRRDIVLSFFAQFPHLTFIWKVTRLEPELIAAARRMAPNVRLIQWMQQGAVLAHPKTRAFITHMGLNSLNEAAVAGVPMVGVPFFGDQQLNSAMAVRRGIARFVDRRFLSVESLREALDSVLNDPRYREASNDVKKKIKAAPFSPTEIFVKTVEYSAKFGSLSEMNVPIDPLYRRLQLDLIAIFLSVITFLIFSLFSTFRYTSAILKSSAILKNLEQSKKVQ